MVSINNQTGSGIEGVILYSQPSSNVGYIMWLVHVVPNLFTDAVAVILAVFLVRKRVVMFGSNVALRKAPAVKAEDEVKEITEDDVISENPRSLKLPLSQQLRSVNDDEDEKKELLSRHDWPEVFSETTETSISETKTETSTTAPTRPKLGAKLIVGLVLFLVVVFLCGIASGVINTFLFQFLATLPGGETGLIQGIRCVKS